VSVSNTTLLDSAGGRYLLIANHSCVPLASWCMSSVAFPHDDFVRSKADVAELIIALSTYSNSQ
jgi:hypothetical protein